MSRRKSVLTPEKVTAFAEQFAALLRSDGWNVDIVRARNVSNPEDIILLTIRMGRKPAKTIAETLQAARKPE